MSTVRDRDVSRITDFTSFVRDCSQIIKDLINTVNGRLEFDRNMFTQTVDVTFGAANTEKAIPHNLKVIASDYIVCKKDVACDVYDGVSTNNTTTIYLKCSVSNANVRLILKGS